MGSERFVTGYWATLELGQLYRPKRKPNEWKDATGRIHVRKLSPVVSDRVVGRNEPCPCGSGGKYKKCCAA